MQVLALKAAAQLFVHVLNKAFKATAMALQIQDLLLRRTHTHICALQVLL